MSEFLYKKKALLSYIDDLSQKNIALAFSGGVDSSLLLKLCCDAVKERRKEPGKDQSRQQPKVYAITVHSRLHPPSDLEYARLVAKETRADEHIILYTDELKDAGILHNPHNRCYLCKKFLLGKLVEKARQLEAVHVLEGTNEDDTHLYRPGIKAVKELGIISPLARYHLTKDEIRRLAAEYGISVSDRPSTPCMATRFPYGTKLSYDMMQKTASGEEWLRKQGFHNVRLRIHGNIARIEVDQEDMNSLLNQKENVINELSKYGFDYITLDLAGFRSGSMDLLVTV